MKPGDRVRFTANSLGVIDPENPYKFAEDTAVVEGDEGVVREAHPHVEGWWLVDVEIDGTTWECPIHTSHAEVIAS